MADKEIKITFAEEKMEALAFFLGEQNEKVESVLTAHLDKTYEKYVPQQVRKFVDSRISSAEESNVQDTGTQRQGRRRSRQNAADHEESRTAGNRSVQEQAVEETEPEAPVQEEAQGMEMMM